MISQKNKNEEDQKIVEEFIKLKPTRAIDRMLNQHSVDKAYQLYNCLQQKIRKNTADLRSTLTEKYQNLVDCSNLLTTIQHFTHQIENIEKDISKIFHQNNNQQELKDANRQQNIITRIEETIYRKKYQSAMNLSHSKRPDELEESQRIYLPYLRIQIIQNLQQELITKKISQKMIRQTISCLTAYIKQLSEEQRNQLVSNTKDLEQGTLIALIAHTLKSIQEPLSEGDILEIVFKCKLFSLNRSQKGMKEDEKISKFFHDIYQLIGEKSRNNAQIQRLAEIFCKNLTQIESHLSETFIVTSDTQIISFRYDLYEQLLSSRQFISILQSLHKIIAENYKEAPIMSLKESFLNLWNNYYKELLILLFNKCDPTSKLSNLSRSKEENIPAQLAKYFVTDQVSVEQHLKNYQEQMKVLIANLKELLNRTHKLSKTTVNQQEIIAAIKQFYTSRVEELNRQIEQTCRKLANMPSQANLRSVILLFFLCDEFNLAIKTGAEEDSNLKDLSQHQLCWNQLTASEFKFVFKKEKKKDWSIQFDTFFMVYSPLTLSKSKLEIVKGVIRSIIQGMLMSEDPQRASLLIQEWKTKKEKSEKESLDRKNRLPDLPQSSILPSTFSKKKADSQT